MTYPGAALVAQVGNLRYVSVLADGNRRVAAEGFALDELEAKLKALGQKAR